MILLEKPIIKTQMEKMNNKITPLIPTHLTLDAPSTEVIEKVLL